MTSLAETLECLSPCALYSPPANWLQGRTAYGGLSSALALHVALNHVHEGLPPLKAAQVSFVGPVAGWMRFQAEVLRRGKSVTQIGVDARADDALAVRASFVFGGARSSSIRHNYIKRPDVQGPEAYGSPPSSVPVPDHFRNFDVRFVGDSVPVSGSVHPELVAWVRLKQPEGVKPEVAMLALGDCLPPASMACFTEPAPISSMNWSIDFPVPARASTWLLQRSRSLVGGDGYSFQVMEMWNEQGDLVMVSTQTVAIFV